jgi:hypothetical protein
MEDASIISPDHESSLTRDGSRQRVLARTICFQWQLEASSAKSRDIVQLSTRCGNPGQRESVEHDQKINRRISTKMGAAMSPYRAQHFNGYW